MDRVEEVLVVGGGSAGFLMALTLHQKVPGVTVRVVRSPDIPVIGVGEGTLASMPVYLHGYLGISPAEFHAAVRPTYKLGGRFLWGSRERFHYTFLPQVNWKYDRLAKPNGYYWGEGEDYSNLSASLLVHGHVFQRNAQGNPVLSTNTGYHLENRPFVAFLEQRCRSSGIEIIDGTVEEVHCDEHGVSSLQLASGGELRADLYVDASGFRSRLLGQALQEPYDSYASSLYCDRAVVGGWVRDKEPMHACTTVETMDAGWAWQIEHETHINRGYVYSSAFVDDDAAEREFRAKNRKVGDTRVVRFPSGCHRRQWVQNVVSVGNAYGFVEPMEATALALICNSCLYLSLALGDCDLSPTEPVRSLFNRSVKLQWESARRFLAVHYKYNRRLDTPFWRACRSDVDLAGGEAYVDYYQSVGPSLRGWQLLGRDDLFGPDGYLTLLVGQQVPYRRSFEPTTADRKAWKSVRAGLAEQGRAGMPQAEALRRIRGPSWRWNESSYRELAQWR